MNRITETEYGEERSYEEATQARIERAKKFYPTIIDNANPEIREKLDKLYQALLYLLEKNSSNFYRRIEDPKEFCKEVFG